MPAYPIQTTRPFPDTLLHTCRQQGDPPADAIIDALIQQQGPTALRTLMPWLTTGKQTGEMPFPDLLVPFFDQYRPLPDWADSAQMKQGMAVFAQHSRAISLILGCFSLPYCYLGADGAQVLWLTERIRHDTARRLQETGEWLFAVMDPKHWRTTEAVDRTLRVRLIHAASRWYARQHPEWDMAWGLPINQEDMAGTNLAFSYVVLLGLREMGIRLSRDEEEAYLHHVNVVGYLNGVSDELLPRNLREAFQLGRAIARRQFKASEAGKGLTQALLQAIARQVNTPESWNLAAGEMRFFLGDTYADMLGVPAIPLGKRVAGVVNRLPLFQTGLL